ncbi:MAG: M48 family metalloprotease [Oscillatoriales cyanobacterium SM2_1_8]|nr:M48 family metalloprotease [Oscillatoriales cyanobacterium SM2_1_8]
MALAWGTTDLVLWGLIQFFSPTLVVTGGWQMVAHGITVVSGILLFFMSPWWIDQGQKAYQKVQWLTLADIEERSPETVEVIETFCERQNCDFPRLGWIDDPNPVAYSYGVLPNSMRLVLSRGLLECLTDDEAAAVCAFQLGRIATGNTALVTYLSAVPQLVYNGAIALGRLGFRVKFGKGGWQALADGLRWGCGRFLPAIALVTRPGAYLADRYGAELTGNPNALMRALPKMARQLVTVNPGNRVGGRLLESTRIAGVLDERTVGAVGMAFELLYAGQPEQNLYRVFLWDWLNPWAAWLSLFSSHPFLGQRLLVLADHAKTLGLTPEYGWSQLVAEAKKRPRSKLYRGFMWDAIAGMSPVLGLGLGLLLSQLLRSPLQLYEGRFPVGLAAVGWGLGLMWRGALRYPNFRRVVGTDLAGLLTDPEVGALRSVPVEVPGQFVRYTAQTGGLGFAIELGDRSGKMYLEYLPSLGDFIRDPQIALRRLEGLVGTNVVAIGWFRRGHRAAIDLAQLQCLDRQPPKTFPSYHQLWNNTVSSAWVLLGLGLLVLPELVALATRR